MGRKRTVFLTGATGLIGSYLLKLFLENDDKVFCLAREKGNKSAKKRVVDALSFWDNRMFSERAGNLIVIEGDITRSGLGIDNKARGLLKSETEDFFHCAAVTEFNWPLEAIRKVNTEGTRNVLEFASGCRNLKKVNHLSTAFVCGNHQGAFSEEDLDFGQKFKTTYEQSKFEAEKVIADYRKKSLWIDIFRPPFVVGESFSGKVSVFQGLYQALQILSLEIFDVFPGKEARLNLVPVDLLSKSILKISDESIAKNKNYHPFGLKPVLLEEIIEAASELAGFKIPHLVGLGELNFDKLTPVQKAILKNNIFVFNPKVTLNSTATSKVLNAGGFSFPEINRETILRLLDYPLKVNFIKKCKV